MTSSNVSTTGLSVLLVPDAFPWILGTWARQIALNGRRHRYYFFSTALQKRDPATWDALVEKMDVVHVLTQHGFAGLPLPEDKATVGTIHHVVKWDELAPVTRADMLCYSASEWRDYLAQQAGVPPERLFEIRTAVDAEIFSPDRSNEDRRKTKGSARIGKTEARRKLGIPEDGFVVGFFGKASSNDGGRKAVDVLAKTFDCLQSRGRRAELLLTGPGWERLVRALRATGTEVTYFPFLHPKEMPVAYKALDAYLITARAEGGPVPLLEAMASAVPVVTTQVGVVPQLVRDGVNGLIIPKDSPEAAADALMTLMGDASLADALGRCARQTILDGWQYSQALKDIDDLYDQAVSVHAQRAGRPGASAHHGQHNGTHAGSGAVTRSPIPALTQPDPKAQREAVLLEDELQWHQSLHQTGYSDEALQLSLAAWRSQPLNLRAGRNLARLGRHQVRQRLSSRPASLSVVSRPAVAKPAGVTLRRQVVDWVRSMKVQSGADFDFRISAGLTPDLLGDCYAVLNLELFDALHEIPEADRARLRSQIAATYQPETGLFIEPSLERAQLPARGHNWEYITWQSTMFARSALAALADRSPYPVHFLDPFRSADAVTAWLDEREWRNPWLESNNVMFIALFMLQEDGSSQAGATAAALDAMLRWLDDHQNPVTGYWDLGRGSSLLNAMAGAFHFYFLYLLTGRRVQYPERIIESTLALQQTDGLFDPRGGGGACLDLDAIDILVKFGQLTDYRQDDIKSALTRAFDGIIRNQNPDGGFCEAHRPHVWKKSRKRQIAELVGLDRLMNRPWQGRPDEFISVSSMSQLRHRVEESDSWATWFRSLALALISTRYPGEFIRDVDWRLKTVPTLGWHDVDQMQRMAQGWR